MGKQIYFYLAPRDLVSIQKRIEQIEPMFILHSRSDTPKPQILDDVLLEENGQWWLYFYLVRREDIGAVVMRHVPAQNYWVVDGLRSPVLEFQRCFVDEKVIKRGRIYCIEKFFGSSDEIVNKSKYFSDWAKLVFSTLKKNMSKTGADYFGNEAKEWFELSIKKFV